MVEVFLYKRLNLSRHRYELQQTGELREEDISIVPDIYIRNQQLDQQIKHLHREVTRFRDAAMWVKKSTESYVLITELHWVVLLVYVRCDSSVDIVV